MNDKLMLQEGVHFVDLQRLIFARRGKACPVVGLDSLAGRLRAGRPSFSGALSPFFNAVFGRRMRTPEEATTKPVRVRQAAPFFGRMVRIGRIVWNSEITVARWELLAVLALGALAAGIVLGVASGRF